MTGHTVGAPAVNSLAEALGGYIQGRSLAEMENDIGSGGVVSEVPALTYGYMVKDERYYMYSDEGLIHGWAVDTLRG